MIRAAEPQAVSFGFESSQPRGAVEDATGLLHLRLEFENCSVGATRKDTLRAYGLPGHGRTNGNRVRL